jgi:class 3 adenylate cyclase
MTVAETPVGTVTVLFTDLVGSTALRSRIGEEAADRLRLEHDQLLVDSIASRGGEVVKHTGDGVMATFTAAASAVGAAVAIQQAIDSRNRRRGGERLEVRIGISVGDVTLAGEDCFGLPVVEAQRLEATAEGGQILCSDIVCRLARGRGGHEFSSVGELVLKGIEDPVPTMEVRWAPVVHVSMPPSTPLPPLLAGPRPFGLAGRATELVALIDAWKDAAEGNRRAVFVSGEPGIGKTRLATELALVARGQGALVLAGRCDEELARPFQPFAEALRFQLGLDEVPARWFGTLAGELTRLVPELSDRVPGVAAPWRGDAESQRAMLFDAVAGWLRATASSVPVLVVLDDLHWADRPTLQLLQHVVRETLDASLCIVGTYRAGELDQTHPLMAVLAELRRGDLASRLALDGLGVDGVAELLERAAGHELDVDGVALARALSDETGGNPFFVGEIVRHLVETGMLVQRDGRWTSELSVQEIGLPEGVREVIGRRVARLDGDAQQLLSLAAVIGHEFTLPVLARVAGSDEDRGVDLLDAARAAGLIEETGVDHYRFGHALVRSALLDEQAASRRARTHRKIAEAIEQLHADDLDEYVAELAYHYGETAVADPGEALHYARRAGQRAYAMAAADEAVHWYTSALDLAEAAGVDAPTRVELLTRLGEAAWASGLDDARARLLDAARLARDAGLDHAMSEALLVNVRLSYFLGQERDPERTELLEYLLDRLHGDAALRAQVMGALAAELVYVGDPIRRGRLLDEARVMAADSGDVRAILYVAWADFTALPHSMRPAPRLREDRSRSELALQAAEELGDPRWIYEMRIHNIAFAWWANDGVALRAHAARLAEVGAAIPGAVQARIAMPHAIAMMEGHLVEAEVLSREMFDASRGIVAPDAIVYGALMQLAVRREQGRLAGIVAGWQAAATTLLPSAAVAAFILAEMGELDEAASRLDEPARTGFAELPDDLGRALSIAMWAETAALVADRKAAAILHDLHTPYDGIQCVSGGLSCGPHARLLARLEDVLDRPDDADRHYADSIEQCRGLMSPVWIARSQLDWAASLVARGDTARARELVDAADDTMGRLTLPALRQHAAELRGRVGGSLSTGTP